MSDVTPAGGVRSFAVRYGPEKPRSLNEPWPNNLKLAGSGTVEVTADAVRFSDARNLLPEQKRTMPLADIANVGVAAQENIIAIRTRNDQREVLVWLASPEDARALLALLPRTTTPEFVERERRHRRFHENLKVIAPRAPVTPALIGINVVLFLVMLAFGAGLTNIDPRVHIFFGANYGPLTWHGQEWRLLTAAFIHFGVIHLAFNMYALRNGGILTERLFGSARFATIYLLSALSGSVASGLWDATRLSAGASGAVFGVFGALFVFAARRRADIPADLLKSVGIGAVLLLMQAVAIGVALDNIDNSAHVGGLLGGVVTGLLLARPFDPEARKVPKPWQIAAVVFAVCAVLAVLVMLLL